MDESGSHPGPNKVVVANGDAVFGAGRKSQSCHPENPIFHTNKLQTQQSHMKKTNKLRFKG